MKAAVGHNTEAAYLAEMSPITHVSQLTPPTFIWGTTQDDVIYIGQWLNYVTQLTANNVPTEFHLFEQGTHSLSLLSANMLKDNEDSLQAVAQWKKWRCYF